MPRPQPAHTENLSPTALLYPLSRRLAALVSPAQLDEAFGALCEDHYRVCLGLPSPHAHHDSDGNVPITERIMMQVWAKCEESVEESVGWPAASLQLQGHDRDVPSWKA